METRINATVLNEAGYEQALYGMALSHSLDVCEGLTDRKIARAKKLAHMGAGHLKFLESIMLWIDVNAPRYWWQQADTYRISSKQSGSTMHTILRRPLEQSDFALPVKDSNLASLNELIENKDFDQLKNDLPEGFLQRRVWCMSYRTLQNIYLQRKNHKLEEWPDFLSQVLNQIEHPEFIKEETNE